MVRKETSAYLFIGQDIITDDGLSKKDAILSEIKKQFLNKTIEDFNLDTLYGSELSLKDLQERLLSLPVKAKKRIILIKDAQNLKENIKEFLVAYLKKPSPSIVLVLDINTPDPKDIFLKHIYNYTQVLRFREPAVLNAFTLSRSIDLKKPAHALKVLNQLLENGEKPEWILSGLRYDWETNITNPFEIRKRLKLLLNCDIEIKTGKLKPVYALEKLVVNLCGLTQSFR
jgi:DNA polymerase III delta subunit